MQIPSHDTNSHCLCVAGEIYCWWQTYHSSTDSSPSTEKSTYIVESSTDSIENLEASGDPSEEMIEGRDNHFENNTTNTNEIPTSPATCNILGKDLLKIFSFILWKKNLSFLKHATHTEKSLTRFWYAIHYQCNCFLVKIQKFKNQEIQKFFYFAPLLLVASLIFLFYLT